MNPQPGAFLRNNEQASRGLNMLNEILSTDGKIAASRLTTLVNVEGLELVAFPVLNRQTGCSLFHHAISSCREHLYWAHMMQTEIGWFVEQKWNHTWRCHEKMCCSLDIDFATYQELE